MPHTALARPTVLATLLLLALVCAPARAAPGKAETRDIQTAHYAQVVSLSLRSLALPEDLQAHQVAALQGPAPGLTVRDGFIRFIAGADTGGETHIQLQANTPAGLVAIPVTLMSLRPTEILSMVDAAEDGTPPPESPPLRVHGLEPGNAIQDAPLAFSVASAPPFDVAGSSATAYSLAANVIVDISKHWHLGARTSTFRIEGPAMRSLRALLPQGELQFSVGLANPDGTFARAYYFNAYRGDIKLAGRLIDSADNLLPSLAGRQVAVRGTGNAVRLVVPVRQDGTFESQGLAPDTYMVELLDVERSLDVVAGFGVYAGSDVVDLQVVAKDVPLPPGVLRQQTRATQKGSVQDRAEASPPR